MRQQGPLAKNKKMDFFQNFPVLFFFWAYRVIAPTLFHRKNMVTMLEALWKWKCYEKGHKTFKICMFFSIDTKKWIKKLTQVLWKGPIFMQKLFLFQMSSISTLCDCSFSSYELKTKGRCSETAGPTCKTWKTNGLFSKFSRPIFFWAYQVIASTLFHRKNMVSMLEAL